MGYGNKIFSPISCNDVTRSPGLPNVDTDKSMFNLLSFRRKWCRTLFSCTSVCIKQNGREDFSEPDNYTIYVIYFALGKNVSFFTYFQVLIYLQQINRLNGVPVLLLLEERHHILR